MAEYFEPSQLLYRYSKPRCWHSRSRLPAERQSQTDCESPAQHFPKSDSSYSLSRLGNTLPPTHHSQSEVKCLHNSRPPTHSFVVKPIHSSLKQDWTHSSVLNKTGHSGSEM